ncbi:MAG: hypothetical protein HYZ50_04665 [Deltaproteobacteria bacterium]|nr:hypothetical protein [Deltaproteobacteria bacterium]
MHAFEHQNSRQTLADSIAEYYKANPGLAQGRGMSQAAREFFRCHDAVHVVYGCGNTLNDEAIVKLSSIFGTTGGLGVLSGYQLHESLQIYKKLRVVEVLLAILQSAFFIPRTLVRCVRQRSRWPWNNFDKYLHVPLREIRQEFAIRVAHATVNETDA